MDALALEELNCCLCKELYRSPVMLGCGHSFCKTCLDKKLQTQHERKCPSCQEKLKPGQTPTPNTLLGNMTSRLIQQKKQPCEMHGEKLLFFCMECEITGCIVCKDSAKHLRHTFLPLQEAEEIFKNKLDSGLQSSHRRFQFLNREIGRQENEVQKLKMTHVQMESHLKSEFQQMHSYLESLENTMKDRLGQETDANKQVMETNLFELEKKSQRMENSISRMQSKRDTKDPGDFLADIKSFFQESSREEEEEMKTGIKVEASTLNLGHYHGPIQYLAWESMKNILQPSLSNIVLDQATAHPALCISNNRTTISYNPTNFKEENSDTPKRYNTTIGILGSCGFKAAKRYWMVDVGLKEEWVVGMAKESCSRKGKFDLTPEQGYWTIKRSKDGVYSALSSPPIVLPVQVKPMRIGVYVDYEEGQVSFYNMNDTAHMYTAHMYTFINNFTESLYPFLSPCENEVQKMRVFNLNF